MKTCDSGVGHPMSAHGTERTYRGKLAVSTLRGEADLAQVTTRRLLMPEGDMNFGAKT